MAAPLYTGKGIQAPQSQNLAIQALSQFGQQEQARSTARIERGYKDRDMFAKMMKLDPVYATSKAAQDSIANIMDGFIDKMTVISKNKRGNFSTEDLMEMQQERGLAQAQMNYIKGASDQITQAYQAAAANPGKYNERLLDEARREWDEQGTLPEGPLLVPAFQNPHERWNRAVQPFRQGATWGDTGSPYQDNTGAWVQPQQRVYPSQGENPEEKVAGMFLSGYEERNNLGWFAETVHDTQPQVWKKYMDKADGDEVLASKLWFNETKPPLYPSAGKDDVSKPSSARVGGINLQLVNGSLWDGKYKQFDTVKNVPVSDGTLDNAILFNRTAAKKNAIPVPSNSSFS